MVQKQPETPSEIIKAARDKSDLTVEELTDRVGITERYLYDRFLRQLDNTELKPVMADLVRQLYELGIVDGSCSE